MKKLKENYVLISLIIFIIFSSIWLIFKGLPYAHDIEFHYSRMISLMETIKMGDILALVHNAFYGFSYALGIFYGNFFFYIPAILCLIGIPKIIAFKIFLVLINIGTILITYKVSERIIENKKISLFTTFIYTFSAYRITDVFVRSAVGEIIAFMIIPIVLLGLYEIIYKNPRKWYYFTIGMVLLLLTHLISTVIMAFVAVIIILINIKKLIKDKERLKYLIISGIIGILLGLFFILPILEQYKYGNINIFIEGSYFKPSDYSVRLSKLIFYPSFVTYSLGLSLIVLIPTRLFYKKKDYIDKKDLISFSDILLVIGIITWILTSTLFPWKVFDKTLSFIQFPWRLLLISTLFISISAGINLSFIKDKKKAFKVFIIIPVIIAFLTNSIYSVQYGIRKNHYNSFKTNEIGTGEYLIHNTDVSSLNGEVLSNKNIDIEYKKNGTSILVTYKNNNYSDTYIEVPLFNYLGYQTDNNIKLETGTNNLIRIPLNKESDTFKVYYKGTSIQKVSYIISLITLILLVIYIIRNKN